jgi:acetyl-CoA carboxylase biotin carboxylase subunit
MLYSGYQIPPFYDSLLGKLIVWGPDRASAMARLKGALGECAFGDIKTTAALFSALLDDPDVKAANFHTNWLETWLADNAPRLAAE